MNAALWIVEILLVVVFGWSALVKGTQSRERAIEIGMTGVALVPTWVMRVAAGSEVAGVIGLLAPRITGIAAILTPLAALGLGLIMVLAIPLHVRLHEPRNVAGNVVLLAFCLFVAWGRWP